MFRPITRIDGKYRVLAQIGQGGTADVSLAVARGPSGFTKLVVLKSMKSSYAEQPELARMFLDEARLAARLNHPNIVQTHEVFEFEGLPVIVMEYLEGQPLSSVIRRSRSNGTFPLTMQLKVLSEALSGLYYSHELQDFDGNPLRLVHRDISPQNVFVTFDGQVKVLDFGIAKLGSSRNQTATGVIKGKLHYMPPEQIAGEALDCRADLYAIGVMLWEAVANRPMWRDEHDGTIMNRVINGELPKLRDFAPDLDADLERLVDKLLSTNPDDRHASAQELQNELDAVVAKLGPPIHMREVGKVVSGLFEDTQAQIKALIESELAKVPELSAEEYAKRTTVELFATYSGYVQGSIPDAEAQAPRRSRLRSALAIAGALAAVAVGAALFLPQRAATASAPGASASAALAPSQVSVRIVAFPANAKVFIDGALMPSNPYTADFRPDPERTYRIVAEADQHLPESRVVTFDRETDLVLVLQHEPIPEPAVSVSATAAPHHARKPGRTPERASAPPKPGPPAGCSPPYYFDADGTKKFKSQCLTK
jgi:eukaryotic-like serine/threonine-protein kinase